MSDELPPAQSVARLRYLNTPTSNWAADRIEELEADLAAAEQRYDNYCDDMRWGDRD